MSAVVTAASRIFAEVTASSFNSAVFTVVSRMSAEVIAPSSIFAEVIASSFTSAVFTVVSLISAELTWPSVIIAPVTEFACASFTNRASPQVESNRTVPESVIGLGEQTTPVACTTFLMVPAPELSLPGAHAEPVHLRICPELAPAWLSLGIVTAASFNSAVFTVVSRMSAEET